MIKPKGFDLVERRADGYMIVGKVNNIKCSIIVSKGIEEDNREWLHVSISQKNRLPDYKAMKFLRGLFIPKDLDAYELFSKPSNHVNINKYCRHLWCCLDGDVLPDFSHGSGSI